MDIKEILEQAVERKASDVFVIVGKPVSITVNGIIESLNDIALKPDDSRELIMQIYNDYARRDLDKFKSEGSDDFAFAIGGLSRFRINVYMQRNTYACVIRVISFDLPDPTKLNIPSNIIDFAEEKKGLILVTGTAGSGKTTTLASIIDRINETKNLHIITLEDPIEYLHRHKKSIVSQREVFIDAKDYVSALRAALRQRPDVILLGEMRDHETTSIALTAAETGHLVLSTLHTIGASNTIDRIIDTFEPSQQRQISIQLSMVLTAVISQQLLPCVDGTNIPAFEIMTVNPAIRNLIRENKIHQLDNIIATSQSENMISMDTYILNLYKQNKITKETAIQYATNPEMLEKKLR